EARSLLSEYERHIAFANVQSAWGRLYNSVGYDLAPTEADASLAVLSRSIRDSLNEWYRVTFDRPPGDKASLPPLQLRLAGLDAAAGAAVRESVGSALARAGLRLADAGEGGDEGDEMAWTLALAAEGGTEYAGLGRWTLLLSDPHGRQALRASHASPLAGERGADALAAYARAAIE